MLGWRGSHVRLKAGRRFVTDGPFAETKELLGGFYVIGCYPKDKAIEWPKKIPLREDRTVEVREVWPCGTGRRRGWRWSTPS